MSSISCSKPRRTARPRCSRHHAVGDQAHRADLSAQSGRTHRGAKTGTADNIRQRYWLVSGMHKLDALTRILEAESFERHDHFFAHQAGHGRAGRQIAGARLFGRRDQRRYRPAAARTHDPAIEGRQITCLVRSDIRPRAGLTCGAPGYRSCRPSIAGSCVRAAAGRYRR